MGEREEEEEEEKGEGGEGEGKREWEGEILALLTLVRELRRRYYYTFFRIDFSQIF